MACATYCPICQKIGLPQEEPMPITPRELARINGTDEDSQALAGAFDQEEQPFATFFGLANREANYATNKFGHFHSAHEAYAVLREEVDEFWDEVKKKQSMRNRGDMLKELIQIAAMAKKAAVSLKLIDS